MEELTIFESFPLQDFLQKYDLQMDGEIPNAEILFINHIPVDELIEKAETLYPQYRDLYPYSDFDDFLKHSINPFLKQLHEVVEVQLPAFDDFSTLFDNIKWGGRYDEYFGYRLIGFKDIAPDNIHFYTTYLTKVIKSFEDFVPFGRSKESKTNVSAIELAKEVIAQPTYKTVKFHGEKTKFIELIKALIENGNLKKTDGQTQESIIKSCAQFFEMDIPIPSKLINDLSKRNNGSETLFLNDLQKSLLNYIKGVREKSSR